MRYYYAPDSCGLFSLWRSNRNVANYKKIRNKCVNENKTSKKVYHEKLQSELRNEQLSPKKWWKIVNIITGFNTKKSDIPFILDNNNEIYDDSKKASIFNEYFASQSVVDDSNAFLPPPPDDPPYEQLRDIFITDEDVENILLSLDSSKACGPDLINPRLLKEAARELSSPLSKLFNKSIATNKFPNAWKQANVTPIFKKDDPHTKTNYRPISLLSIVGKVMERCVFKYLHNYILDNNILTEHQSGFTPGDSTINQLLYLSNDILKAVDSGKEVRVVFCDISKAFDRVWHSGILYKLSSIGITGNLLSWFHNYLFDRKQRVVLRGNESTWHIITAGVPQGSILGPLLFLIYINDIVCEIQSNIKLFADDTSLYIIVENPNLAATALNNDLERINAWSRRWLVDFNPNKTNTITFSRSSTPTVHPPLIFNNTQLNEVSYHKHLGVHLSQNLSWVQQVDYMVTKASTRLNILRKLKFFTDRITLQKIYFSFVRPILEYADIVWDNIPANLVQRLENVQIEAARIVAGATKLVSINKLYTEVGWQTLTDRRKIHRLILFYKIVNGQAPPYLLDLVPSQREQIHTYPTRNRSYYVQPNFRTNLYGNSFLCKTIRDWNNLPLHIRNCNSLNSFKTYMNRDNNTVPKYYLKGTRKAQIYHARLRMNCSSLNETLFNKNIVGSPNCSCGQLESVRHYLLQCPRFDEIREITIGVLPRPVSVNTLLFGNSSLSGIENNHIFEIVQNYIMLSKRFEL